MFHLDNNSGVSSMPAVSAMQDNAPRWFTEGGASHSPSWPGQDWFNIVQAELLNVLTTAGISPDKAAFNQLALSIKAIINKDALLKSNLLSEIKGEGASSQKTARENLDITDATLNKKGLVQLSSSVESTSEVLAATPKAVKTANDNANGRVSKSGDEMTGKLTLPQTSSFGVNTDNALGGNSIAIGDSDTGFKQISDGNLALMADSEQVGYLNAGELQHRNKMLTQLFRAIVTDNWSVGSGGFAGQNDTAAPFYVPEIRRPNDDNNYFPLIKQKVTLEGGYPVTFSMGLLTTGQTTFPQIVIQAKTDNASYDRLWILDAMTGDFRIPGRMLLGDAIFTTSGDSYGSVWGYKWLSQWLSEAFASRDNNINARATFDWVRLNFVQNVMLGAEVQTSSMAAPPGCVITFVDGGDVSDMVRYKPIQIYINDAWRTIAG